MIQPFFLYSISSSLYLEFKVSLDKIILLYKGLANGKNFASTSTSLFDYKTAEVRSNRCWSERKTLTPTTVSLYCGVGRGREFYNRCWSLSGKRAMRRYATKKKKNLLYSVQTLPKALHLHEFNLTWNEHTEPETMLRDVTLKGNKCTRVIWVSQGTLTFTIQQMFHSGN